MPQFFDLPLELRWAIYDLLPTFKIFLQGDHAKVIEDRHPVFPLLLTNKQISGELDHLLGSVPLKLTFPTSSNIPKDILSRVETIELGDQLSMPMFGPEFDIILTQIPDLKTVPRLTEIVCQLPSDSKDSWFRFECNEDEPLKQDVERDVVEPLFEDHPVFMDGPNGELTWDVERWESFLIFVSCDTTTQTTFKKVVAQFADAKTNSRDIKFLMTGEGETTRIEKTGFFRTEVREWVHFTMSNSLWQVPSS